MTPTGSWPRGHARALAARPFGQNGAMKAHLGIVLAAVSVTAVWLAFSAADRERAAGGPAPVPLELAPADERRTDELAARVEQLERELGDLARDVSWLRSAEQRTPVTEPEAEIHDLQLPEGSATPQWYLRQYTLSFLTRDEGSEYFRLAVEAYAPSLLADIQRLVISPGSHAVLRLRLVQMLGDARFVEHAGVIGTLLQLIASGGDQGLVQVALAALGQVADARTGVALERIVWSIPWPRTQREVLRLILDLAGDAGNATLVRLLASAPDDATRAFLVTLLDPSTDPASALDAFRFGSTQLQPVRLQAAHRIGAFRDEPFVAFVDEWSRREVDADVRAVLASAQRSQTQVPAYHALQATGEPDADPNQDHPRAWASKSADQGEQWLELTYDPPLRASVARIFEVNVAGAVTRLEAFDSAGTGHLLWSGTDPTTAPGVFEVGFAPTPYRIRRLLVTLDTNLHSGWNEIDAAELSGVDGSAWARGARASSSFAD